jgi:hypothetical protein
MNVKSVQGDWGMGSILRVAYYAGTGKKFQIPNSKFQ